MNLPLRLFTPLDESLARQDQDQRDWDVAVRAGRVVKHTHDDGSVVLQVFSTPLSAELQVKGAMPAGETTRRFHPDGERRIEPTKRILRGAL